MCVCAYLFGLGLHVVQRWKVTEVFLQSLDALLFVSVLFALSLTFLLQAADVAIPRLYLSTKTPYVTHTDVIEMC